MAVKSEKVQSSLILEYKVGTNDKGKDIMKRQRFSKVDVTVSDETVHQVGKVLESLMFFPVNKISREDDTVIVNQ